MRIYYLKINNQKSEKLKDKVLMRNFYSKALKYYVLSDYYGVHDLQIKLEKNIFGKPYFYKKNTGQVFDFNLSHSGDFIIIGVNGNRLGVDIEKIDKWPEQISKEIFTRKELMYIKQFKDENVMKYRIWSLKEAVTKCLGTGLLLNTLKIEVNHINNEIYSFQINKTIIDGYGISFIYDGYVLSFVSAGNMDINFKKINVNLIHDFINKSWWDIE